MARLRRGELLLALAAVCAAFAVFVGATGGVDTRIAGIAVRSRSWERPATIAALLGLAGLYSLRQTLASWAPAAARLVVPLLLAWVLLVSLWFGTYAAGGADSYGYLSQARLFAHGRLTDTMPRHERFDWPDVPATLTPLAYTRNAVPDVLVPVYPPGLPLMLAPLTLLHANAVFVLVPICAVFTVWLTVLLGRELGEPAAGVLGALLVAASPTFLLQSLQPMSDVPVAALWLWALVLARRVSPGAKREGGRPMLAGVVASLAILVRPNLAPLLLFVAAAAATVEAGAAPAPHRLRRPLQVLFAAAPGIGALAAIQAVRYGSPLGSGYGSFDDLFGLENIVPNLARYPRWMSEAHTPLIWLWLLAPVTFGSLRRGARAFAWVLYAFAAAVVLAYLPYVYFRPDEWSYTRFLLPALPVMTVLLAWILVRVARGVAPRAPLAAAASIVVVVAALSLHAAVARAVFDMREAERKYPAAGAYVLDRLPATAFVLAAQHSGSVRYYSGRPTLRWDLLDAASLDRAIGSLRAAGYEPYAVLDAGEDEAFRSRFAARSAAIAGLVPLAAIGNTHIYAFR